MSSYDLETTIQLPDEEDVDVLIEFEVHSWGSPAVGPSFNHPGDPPEPAEFDITAVVRSDNGDDIPGPWSLATWELVADRVYEIDQERGYGYDY